VDKQKHASLSINPDHTKHENLLISSTYNDEVIFSYIWRFIYEIVLRY